MKRISLLLTVLTLVMMIGCSRSDTSAMKIADHSQPLDGEAEILQSWQGDYPVTHLKLMPEKQREQAVGFIDDAKTFEDVWKAFKPGEAVPPSVGMSKYLVVKAGELITLHPPGKSN